MCCASLWDFPQSGPKAKKDNISSVQKVKYEAPLLYVKLNNQLYKKEQVVQRKKWNGKT